MRKPTITSRLGIVVGVLATVVIGPSAAVAAALDEANRAPLHDFTRPAATVAADLPCAGYTATVRGRAVPA